MLWFCLSVAADDSSVKGYAIENIENYEFETEKEELIIEDLSVLHAYALDSQRKELKDLLARKLAKRFVIRGKQKRFADFTAVDPFWEF